jgi:hypothetical protein
MKKMNFMFPMSEKSHAFHSSGSEIYGGVFLEICCRAYLSARQCVFDMIMSCACCAYDQGHEAIFMLPDSEVMAARTAPGENLGKKV